MDQSTTKKTERTYLQSAMGPTSPWAGSPPTADGNNRGRQEATTSADHSTSHLYGISVRNYPGDCPPLKVQWFHAVDASWPPLNPRFLFKFIFPFFYLLQGMGGSCM